MRLRVRLAFWPVMVKTANRVLGGAAMIALVMAFAFTTMRLSIHGGQVEVPNLAGMTVADATHTTVDRGLNLVLVNRFYSTTVPAGRIISQTPAPGTIVRHEWEVRGIESLGPQRVSIPDVNGLAGRPASMEIRKVSLDLGTVAHLPAPGPVDLVLAQTPPPNAGGVDSPRVSLLLSAKDDARATAFVMPSLAGMSLANATSRIAALGLYVIVAPAPEAAEASPDAAQTATAVGAGSGGAGSGGAGSGGTVVAQTPAAGHRVARGEGVKLTLSGS